MRTLPLPSLLRSLFALLTLTATAAAQIPGPVVNIDANDPHNPLQKQVEVDTAANPLNPSHVLAGYIDYRTTVTVVNGQPVVNETSLQPKIISKAWCAYSFSTNGGKTWKNFLVPGFPGDTAPGSNSPIFGSDTCGDPTTAWDTAGHAFFLGLAQRPDGINYLFVARFTDLDNGQGRLEYNFTRVIGSGNPSGTGQDLDKPSLLFVPDPTPGSNPAAGTLYACGTIFDGSQGSKVVCAYSTDNGTTFLALNQPNQTKVNGNVALNNGTAMAPARNGGVYVFWRSFGNNANSGNNDNGYWFVIIDRFGNATAPSRAVGGPGFYPYDAPTLPELARSNAFPAVGTDATGRILLAFQAYSDPSGFMAPPSAVNTPRIFLTYSTTEGLSWSTPRAVDYGPPGGNAFQFMPRLAVAGGGVFDILYYDARNDGRPITNVSGRYFPYGRDRRYDVRVVQGQFGAGGTPVFTLPSVQVSQYARSSAHNDHHILDRPGCAFPGTCPALLYPNLPIAGGGLQPFIGDYIALAPGVPLVRNATSALSAPPPPAWRFANQTGDPQTFLALFTSTQDVGFPGGLITGNWTNFVPAGFPNCANPWSRDANVYFSLISPGIAASWSGTSQNLVGPTGPIPPEFIATVENRSGTDRYFRMTILDSAPTEDWSFLQTPPAPAAIPADQQSVDTQILRHSSVSLPVYYRFRSSTNASPTTPVQVSVQQITGIGGTVIGQNDGGLQTTISYVLSPSTLQVDNLQVDNLQVDNTSPSNLQVDNLQVDNLQVDNASPSNLQVDNLQVDNLQIDNLQVDNKVIPDQDVTFTVSGTGSFPTPVNAITNVVNGDSLLNSGYAFQLLIYQTQHNAGVSGCTIVDLPTDVVISNIAVLNQPTNNLQVDNLQVDNLQVDNAAVNDPQLSNATFVANAGEEIGITLRTYIPTTGATPFSLFDEVNPANSADDVGQAAFSTAANSDGNRPSSFFDFTAPIVTFTVIGSQRPNGYYFSPVTVNWSVSDQQSGIVSKIQTVNPPPPAGIVLPTQCTTTVLAYKTDGTTLTCTARNGDGDVTIKSVTIKIK